MSAQQSAEYWAGDTLGKIKLHQQWHRPVVLNKLIIDTTTKFWLYIRQTRVSSTKDSSVSLESQKVKSQIK